MFIMAILDFEEKGTQDQSVKALGRVRATKCPIPHHLIPPASLLHLVAPQGLNMGMRKGPSPVQIKT